MIQFSAQGAYLLLAPQGRALFQDRALIRDRALIFFFLRNNRNCNSYKLLKELFILTVNIKLYMYGMVNVHDFICSRSMTSVSIASIIKLSGAASSTPDSIIRIGCLFE